MAVMVKMAIEMTMRTIMVIAMNGCGTHESGGADVFHNACVNGLVRFHIFVARR